MSDEKQAKPLKKKTPTAKKRDIQNDKKRLRSRAFKARVRTALNAFEKAAKEGGDAKAELNAVYSMMDKGVKRGVYKLNRASRTKSKMQARLQKTA